MLSRIFLTLMVLGLSLAFAVGVNVYFEGVGVENPLRKLFETLRLGAEQTSTKQSPQSDEERPPRSSPEPFGPAPVTPPNGGSDARGTDNAQIIALLAAMDRRVKDIPEDVKATVAKELQERSWRDFLTNVLLTAIFTILGIFAPFAIQAIRISPNA